MEGSAGTVKFSCPQCGAPLNPRQADCFFACTHCGSSLYLDLDALLQVTTYRIGIGADEAPLLVRRHLVELALDEAMTLRDQELIFIPFWSLPGSNLLQRASATFPGESLPAAAAPQQAFIPERLPAGSRILPVETQPGEEEERRLVFIPFHRVKISHKSGDHFFLCEAVSGGVFGPSIPREPDPRVSSLFRLFLGIFLVLLTTDILMDTPWVLLSINAILFFLAFEISIPRLENRLYK